MSGTVLIVDDSLTVRMDLAEAFQASGFRAVPCETIAQAREALARGPLDVLVLDVLLPDGDGIELLKEVRESETAEATPVLMLSSEADVKDRIRGLTTGADEYVGKPYDTGYVVARARELVRARRAGQSNDQTTILLVDDSLTYRDNLSAALERKGYRVVQAGSGEEGLRAAADQRPSALVVDGVLPGADGATVIRRIRLDAALRGMPCLLLTASESGASELAALDAGADAFVRKEEDVEVILARIAAMLRATRAAPIPQTASLLGPRRVLAVDDSATYLHELAAVLGSEGYDVVLARSGAEALDLLAVQPVDCVLLDLLMPGLSGQETCRRIKAAPVVRDIPLILLTAMDDRTTMLEGLGAGADDYIPKSSDFEVLKARVRAQIRRKQFEDENRRIREELLRKEIEAGEARAAKELAEARASLVEELQGKNRELESFSYSVSHDLRAPLRAIDGYAQAVLEDYGGRIDATGQDYLHRVRKAAQRMGELIDDLLQLSRVSVAELRREPVDLTKLARSVVEDLRRRDPDRSVEVRIQDDLQVQADSSLLQIVLENLMGNAWKFTRPVELGLIEVGWSDREGSRECFVRDNGAGFDMKYAARLFHPFQRLHSEENFKGTGIGLATVRRIIERHKGTVRAESAVGQGATFYFTVDRRRAPRPRP